MAEHLLRYTADAALRQRSGIAGRRRVEQQFSLDNMVERYARLYEALLRQARPAKEA